MPSVWVDRRAAKRGTRYRAMFRLGGSAVLPELGSRPIDGLTAADVAGFVAKLADEGYARESIRKSVTAHFDVAQAIAGG